MDEDQITKMSVPGMLLVTGFSCLLFSFIMKILDGGHSRFFLLAGGATVTISILTWLAKNIQHYVAVKKKRKNRSYSRS
ncbi:MAG: hypothetical protein ABIR30_03300 [Chitinophagaceae bacterium]